MGLSMLTRQALAVGLASEEAASEIARTLNSLVTTGKILYVHYGTGKDGAGAGLFPEAPFKTIDYAIGQCTANKGDVIIAMPGHAESVAADIDVDVAGITIIGAGVGESRPVVTFITETAAKIDVDAANCRIANLVLKNDIDSQVVVVDVDGAGTVLEDLELLEGSSKQFLIGIDIAADRTVVRRCYIKSVAVGANSGIKISAANDRISLVENEVFGDFADACIHNPTSAVATRLNISKNVLTNLQTGDHAIELVSACTGVINFNIGNSTLAAAGTRTAIDPGSCYCCENYGSDAVGDVNGVLNPAADA
jgi:hypothetical protein